MTDQSDREQTPCDHEDHFFVDSTTGKCVECRQDAAEGRKATLPDDHDCPYMGVRSCCSTDFCEDCICYDPAEEADRG